jgi:hypothetical protein
MSRECRKDWLNNNNTNHTMVIIKHVTLYIGSFFDECLVPIIPMILSYDFYKINYWYTNHQLYHLILYLLDVS